MMKSTIDDVILCQIHKDRKEQVRVSRRIKALKRQEYLTIKNIKLGERKMRDQESLRKDLIDECMSWCETSEQAEYFVDFLLMTMVNNIDPSKASEICQAKYNPSQWIVINTKDQAQLQ